jgi:hypothetical protein
MPSLALLRIVAPISITGTVIALLALNPHSSMLAFALMLPLNSAGRQISN